MKLVPPYHCSIKILPLSIDPPGESRHTTLQPAVCQNGSRELFSNLLTMIAQNHRFRHSANKQTKMTPGHNFAVKSVRQYVADLFETNEFLGLSEAGYPLTDEQLEDAVLVAYCNSHDVIQSMTNLSTGTCTSRIRVWRSEYNRNLWARTGQPQRMHSFRYGIDGKPINKHCNPLTADKVWQAILETPCDPRKELYVSATQEVEPVYQDQR